MIFYSATINDIYMLDEYDMPLESLAYTSPPKTKTNVISVPGRNGSLDLTDFYGRVFYEDRTITMIFGCGKERLMWPTVFSDIANKFHGQKVKIIFDDDPAYFYVGRASVDNVERAQRIGKLTITVTAEPYKYELCESGEDWLWDPLDFVFGIIREYSNITVNGSLKYIVEGSAMPVILELESSADMTVTYKNKTYDIKAGTNKIYGIEIVNGANELIFKGTGTITIHYRGGSL